MELSLQFMFSAFYVPHSKGQKQAFKVFPKRVWKLESVKKSRHFFEIENPKCLEISPYFQPSVFPVFKSLQTNWSLYISIGAPPGAPPGIFWRVTQREIDIEI